MHSKACLSSLILLGPISLKYTVKARHYMPQQNEIGRELRACNHCGLQAGFFAYMTPYTMKDLESFSLFGEKVTLKMTKVTQTLFFFLLLENQMWRKVSVRQPWSGWETYRLDIFDKTVNKALVGRNKYL